jgi:hypothetical protein
VPHVLKNKKEINTFIKNLTLGFTHLLCDKILFVKRSIFYIAMSFMVVFILAIIMGDKLNIIVTGLVSKTLVVKYDNYLYYTIFF